MVSWGMSDTTTLQLDQLDDFYRVLYYGDPGLGKTTAIARAANRGPLVYIDAERGLKPKALRQRGVEIGNIEVHRDIRWDALWELYLDLTERLAKDPDSVYAVAWDTTTKSQDLLMDPVVDASVERDHAKGKHLRTEFEIHLEDRGVVSAQLQKLLRKFHSLNCHLIIGAHQRKDKDEEGAVVVGPGMGPSAAAAFAGYMDSIIHVRLTPFGEEVEYSGRTRPDGRFIAKDRFSLLPPNMVDPWFDRVVDYYDEVITKETDPRQIQARQRRLGMKPATPVTEAGEAVDAPVADAPDGDD